MTEEVISSGPCQLCMSGSSFGAEKAQYVLIDGFWNPWPLVASRPMDKPMVRLRCHICDPEGYAEDAATLNALIERAKRSANSALDDESNPLEIIA